MKRLMLEVILAWFLGIGLTRTTMATTDHVLSDVSPTVAQLLIIDAHGHLNGDMSAKKLIELMDQAGVSRMVLMPRYYTSRRSGGEGSDEQALNYSTRYPGRFIPVIGGQRSILTARERWLKPDGVAEDLLAEAETKLKSGKFYGVGEFILRHYAYDREDGQGGSDHDIPIDTILMRRFMDLSAKYRVPLVIHAEGEPEVVAGMESLLTYNLEAKVIWAHSCGRSSAEIIHKMLSRHSNLYCDLGAMLNAPFAGYGRYWPKRTQWMFLIEDGSGHLYPDMKALYEELPDRFLIGTDCAHTSALKNYAKRIERFRKLLSDLKPETARRIAFQNAEKLFRK